MKHHRKSFRFLLACGGAHLLTMSSYAGTPAPIAPPRSSLEGGTSDGDVVRAHDATLEVEPARTNSAPSVEESLCRDDPEAWTSTEGLDAMCPVDCLHEALADAPAVAGDALVTQSAEQGPTSTGAPVSNGLASIDPSIVPAAVVPKYECVYDSGCKERSQCMSIPGNFIPDVSYSCIVTDCGPSRCSSCPNWIAERLKNLAVKAWCAYVCVQPGTSPPKEVAIGAGAVSSLGGAFIGLWCLKEIPEP